MSEKRRDNRGRILHNGESQRQDGWYAYKYKDLNGEYKFVYSWRLDKNDWTPAGRARDHSLREKERQIQQDLFKKIVPNGGDLTVLELVQKYLSLKVNVRHNTQANYNFVLNIIKKEDFGKLRIDKVKQSDAKAWLIKMQKVDGRGYSSIHSIRTWLNASLIVVAYQVCDWLDKTKIVYYAEVGKRISKNILKTWKSFQIIK